MKSSSRNVIKKEAQGAPTYLLVRESQEEVEIDIGVASPTIFVGGGPPSVMDIISILAHIAS